MQDAFLKFALARAPVVQPKAYLFRCVANGCCDLRAGGMSAARRSVRRWLPPKRKTRSLLKRNASIRCSAACRPNRRMLSASHTFGSLRFTEIAEVLDCPVTTVKSRFRYGIDKLKNVLKH